LVSFFYALLLSYAIGIAIGVWMGFHRLSGAVGEPILISLYTLPKVTLYPVVLLIFGLSVAGRVTFGAMHGVLPVALLTMNAIRNIPPVYLKSSQALHLSKWQVIATVLLPATLPEVVAGLRIGFTLTLLGVLLAEMFAAKHGLGSLIINAMQLLQGEEMVSVALVLFAFAARANAQSWSSNRAPAPKFKCTRSARSCRMTKPGKSSSKRMPTTTSVRNCMSALEPGTPCTRSLNGFWSASVGLVTRI